MALVSFVLLLLQVHVVHVFSFSTQQQPSHFESLSKQHRSLALQRIATTTLSTRQSQKDCLGHSFLASASSDDNGKDTNPKEKTPKRTSTYNLGVGKNPPVGSAIKKNVQSKGDIQWNVPDHPNAKVANESKTEHDSLQQSIAGSCSPESNDDLQPRRVRRMVARTEESSTLRGAIWHEEHYSTDDERDESTMESANTSPSLSSEANCTDLDVGRSTSLPMGPEDQEGPFQQPELFYPNIDLSIPPSVYNPETSTDIVWDLMRWEAYQEAQREPLLVSFLYSSILNHDSLESSLAFLLANKLSSAAMISTQVQSLILDALDKDPSIGRSIRADIMVSKQPASQQLESCFVFLFLRLTFVLPCFVIARPYAIGIPHAPAYPMSFCISKGFMRCKPIAWRMPSGRRTTSRCWRITFNRKCPKRSKLISTQTQPLVSMEDGFGFVIFGP